MESFRRFGRTLASGFVLLLMVLPAYSQERNIFGKVIEVVDGDTVTILDDQQKQHIIRLAGIDAPELNQDHGKKARKFLSELVHEKNVTATTSKIDRNGEYVGKVLVYGRDVGLEMVIAGFAWHYKQYVNDSRTATGSFLSPPNFTRENPDSIFGRPRSRFRPGNSAKSRANLRRWN